MPGFLERERRKAEQLREASRLQRLSYEERQIQIQREKEEAIQKARLEYEKRERLKQQAWDALRNSGGLEVINNLAEIIHLHQKSIDPDSQDGVSYLNLYYALDGEILNRKVLKVKKNPSKNYIPVLSEFSSSVLATWDSNRAMVLEASPDGLISVHGEETRLLGHWEIVKDRIEDEVGSTYDKPIIYKHRPYEPQVSSYNNEPHDYGL